MIIRARVRTLGVLVLVDSSGVRSMRWVVGVGAADSVEGLVACPEGFPLLTQASAHRRVRYRPRRAG